MLAILLACTILAILIFNMYKERAKLPPGPPPLPLIGNIPQMALGFITTGGLVKTLKHLKEEYGPVYTLWLGPFPTVHICDLETAQEAMVKHGGSFADRWVPDVMNEIRNDMGIIATNGQLWTEQRRFALHTLRNFGLGRNLMEQRIMAEFDYRLERMESSLVNDKWSGNPAELIEPMVGSIINRILFSVRFEEDNEKEFFELKRQLDSSLTRLGFLDFMLKRWMFGLPIINLRTSKLMAPITNIKKSISNQVNERVEAIKNGSHVIDDEPADYCDAFLAKMKTEPATTTFTHEELVINIVDLWAAGQETTTTTLLWGLIHLVARPDICQEVREELLMVAGDGHVSLSHRKNTPKLNVVLMEVQRLASIVAVNLWRKANEDVTFGKYHIPKGTRITAEISVIMSDDKFKKPDEFNPWRYLSDGKLEENVVPFGLGKRACLGESLARAELYLILGNLLLNYEFLPVGQNPDNRPISDFGILKRPRTFEMTFKRVRDRISATY